MSSPLLTIVVPTYNRAECLSLLLTTLTVELRELEDKVTVIVGDNASTDHTPAVTGAFKTANPAAEILRHSENLGPEENFCRCIDHVESRFFWIIGDDDLPKSGVLRRIVYLLQHEDPDILYLNSEWMPHITSADDGELVTTLTAKVLSREEFARRVNVWVTFISGMVVNLERLHELNPGLSMRRFTGSSLVQLGWVLPLLMAGSRFEIIQQPCVLATSGNTGGYQLFTVFGTNFPSILDAVCGSTSRVRQTIIKRLVWSYLPSLLWMNRFGRGGTFKAENILEAVAPLRSTFAYWIVILPMSYLPKFLALFFWAFFRIIVKVIEQNKRFLERIQSAIKVFVS